MMTVTPCMAKIRPFPNDTELTCSLPDHGSDINHRANMKDNIYPYFSANFTWFDEDLRAFRGDWIECTDKNCILSREHRDDHVYY
jgi:hypothetical protein